MSLHGAVLLELPTQMWECPNCDLTKRTEGFTPNLFHTCRGTGIYAGLTAPMVPAGTRAKVEAREREDYIGREQVQMHRGRPVMSVTTVTDESQSVAVFAPTARITGE